MNRTITILAATLLALTTALAKDTTLSLVVDLTDGSRLIGTTTLATLPVRSEMLGKLQIPLEKIRSIKFRPDHESMTITLSNGDNVKAGLGEVKLQLETAFGEVTVPWEHVTELSVTRRGGGLPESLKLGLVLHYSFDRDEGGRVTDLSGKNRNGVVHGAKWTSEGITGGAYHFNGQGDYLDTGCNLSGMDEITVGGWVRPDRAQPGASVVTQFGGPPGDNVWGLFAQADSSTEDPTPPHKGYVTVLTMAGRRPTAWGQPSFIGKWTHLCFTFKRDGQLVLYKDGIAVGQAAAGNAPLNKRDSTAKVGASWNADAYWANGLIDEVMIYNRALTADEIKQIHSLHR